MTAKMNLSEREVNARYGLGLRHLRGMRLRNDGPRFIKVSGQIGKRGGRVLYPVSDLERWLLEFPSGGSHRT